MPRHLALYWLFVIGCCAAIRPAPSYAEWIPDGTPICTAPGDQELGRGVPDGEGGAYVLWRDQPWSNTVSLVLQRIGADGTPAIGWPAEGLRIASGNVLTGDLASDSAGGVYVCWIMDGPADTCFAARIDGSGQGHPGWPSSGFVVAATGASDQYNTYSLHGAYVLADGTGAVHVVVYNYARYCLLEGPCNSYSWVSVARVSQVPGVVGQESPNDCWGSQRLGTLISDLSGGVAAFSSTENYCAEFMRWPSSGEVIRSQGTASSLFHSVANDGVGGFWLLGRPAPTEGMLMAQRVSTSGTPLSGWEQGVKLPLRNVPYFRRAPMADGITSLALSVMSDASTGLLLVWDDRASPWLENTSWVRASKLSLTGETPAGWDANGIDLTDRTVEARSSTAVSDGAGGAYISWIDARDAATTGRDIYALRLLADGSIDPAYPFGGRRICASSPYHYSSLTVPTEPGAAMVIWNDYRDGNNDIYAQRLPLDQATPALVSLVRADATAERVSLAWRVAEAGTSVTLQRRIEPGVWTDLATLTPDGLDQVAYEDFDAPGGARVGYRLMLADGSSTDEAWVTVPTAALSLAGFSPNPSVSGSQLAFTLAGDSPATVEVLDITGRRVYSRDLAGLGAGHHRLQVEARLAPGVYVIRLAQAGAIRTARGVVTR